MEGEVLVDGVEAVIGQEVIPGATIRTGVDSYCDVVFQGNNVFRLRPESTLVLNIDRGVRGTAFFVEAESEDSTYVCTCNGRLSLTNVESGRSRRVRADHHKAYRFVRVGEAVERRTAPMQSHTDEEMEEVAAVIGSTIEWGSGY